MQAELKKDLLGLEIGPLHNPICPKKDGWNILTMDILPTNLIKKQYKDNPDVDTAQIEDIDIIFSGSLFKSLKNYGLYRDNEFINGLNCLDYIISSHNFEHQPNPIQFLVDCENALRTKGVLSMAIPIGSRCFDCWRPLTTCGEWIDAFYAQREMPSYGNIVDSFANHAKHADNVDLTDESYSLNKIKLNHALAPNYLEHLCELSRDKSYVDSHCSVLNPYSFQSLFDDLVSLGLIKLLRVKEIKLNGAEFIVTIIKSEHDLQASMAEQIATRRTNLTRRAIEFHYKDLMRN